MRVTILLLLMLLPSCISSSLDKAHEKSADIVTKAGAESALLVEQAGAEARKTVVEAGEVAKALVDQSAEKVSKIVTQTTQELEKTGKVLINEAGDRIDGSIDRAADHAERIVVKVPEAAKETRQETESLLKSIQRWWVYAIAVLLIGAVMFMWIRTWIISKRRKQTLEAVVGAVDDADSDEVRAAMRERMKKNPDAHKLEREIRTMRQ